MKISNIILFLTILTISQLTAQELVTVDAKKISQKDTPVTIVEAIKKDFPNTELIDYYLLPADKIDTEWAITTQDNRTADQHIDHYTVLLKGKNGGHIYGLYDKNGSLEMMKVTAKDFALPPAVQSAATSGKYAGYTIKSDKFVRILNRKKEKEYLEVSVFKGAVNKKLYFSQDGKLLKEK